MQDGYLAGMLHMRCAYIAWLLPQQHLTIQTPTVQPRKFPLPYCTSTPTRPGRLQIHVQQPTRNGVVRAELLL